MRAERVQRARPHLRALQRDRRAGVILRLHQRRDAERPPQRAREDAEADHAGGLEPAQHRGRQRALEHGALEREAVDQQRRVERVERGHADVVERARPRPPEVGLAGLDVADQVGLGVGLARSPAVLERDPQRAAAALLHRVCERLELGRVTVGVGEREHGRLRRPLAARLVGAAAPAAAEGECGQGRREDCTGWGGTHPWPPWLGVSRRYVWASRRTSGPTRHFARAGPRVFPDAPRVEGVRGCACEATPPGRAHRRPRARGDRARGRPWHAGVVAGRRVGRREPRVRRGRLGARGLRGRGVGTEAGEPVRAVAGGGRRRLVRRRAQQPRRRLLAAVHGRPAGLRGVPGDRRARGARVSRRAAAGPARARRTRARLCRHPARPRPAARPDLRPRRAGLRRLPGQPARRHERARRRRGGHARRPRPRPRVGARARAAGALRGRPLLPRRPAAARTGAAARRRLPRARGRRLRPRRLARLPLQRRRRPRPVARAGGRARAARARGRVGVGARAAGAHPRRAARDRAR